MKEGILPEYKEARFVCSCGNVMETRSSVKEMHVYTCSKCHPFFTGQATYVDSEGRIEHFRKRYSKTPKAAK